MCLSRGFERGGYQLGEEINCFDNVKFEKGGNLMTSREIVKKALVFEEPERIPMALPLPYPHDFRVASYKLKHSRATDWYKVDERKWERVDEWGNKWLRIGDISKGEVSKGILENLDDVEKIELPRLDDYNNYKEAQEIFSKNKDKYKLGSLPGFAFNIARKMRRFDQYLMDILLEKEKIIILNKRINELLKKAIENYAKAGADAIFFCEDWGTQNGLLINPKLWREVFKEGFIDLCSFAHKWGIRVFMHSCGKITEIIPDLIEAGVDVLQFDQPRIHGIDKLAEFSGKVTFWCPVDIQRTLQSKNEKLIRDDVREMIAKLGGKGGGFIAGYYGDNKALGLDPKWQDIACKAFVEMGSDLRWIKNKKDYSRYSPSL